MSDDNQQYVDAQELAYWKTKDPIDRLSQRLSPSEIEAIKSRVQQRIDVAVKFAVQSPYPGFETILTDVYA